MTGTGKEFFGAGGIDGSGELRAFGFVELGIVKVHAGMRAVERDARPGDVHGRGVDQRNSSNSAGSTQYFPTFGCGLVMCSQSSRNLGWRPGEDDDDLAANVDVRKVVIILFRDFEPIADENH